MRSLQKEYNRQGPAAFLNCSQHIEVFYRGIIHGLRYNLVVRETIKTKKLMIKCRIEPIRELAESNVLK